MRLVIIGKLVIKALAHKDPILLSDGLCDVISLLSGRAVAYAYMQVIVVRDQVYTVHTGLFTSRWMSLLQALLVFSHLIEYKILNRHL